MGKGEKKSTGKTRVRKNYRIVILVFIIVVIGAVISIFAYNEYEKNRKIELKTKTESELMKVMKESNLYTAEYPYNGYTGVKDDKGKIEYYVAYNGTVKAGFDINKVDVNADIDNSIITVRLPKVTILSSSVDTSSLQYIFENKKYETETIASEAYQKAVEDLNKKAASYKEIITVGTENAKKIEENLVDSWVNYPGAQKRYKVRILTYEEAENDQTESF